MERGGLSVRRRLIMKRCVPALFAAATMLAAGGCVSSRSTEPVSAGTPASPAGAVVQAADRKGGTHQTAHGGVLNAIEKCEIGHAEVKREGDTLRVWFVGGAPDTT